MKRWIIFLCLVWALYVFGQVSRDDLANGLQSHNPQLQLQTLGVLEKQRYENLVGQIISLLKSDNPNVRRRAVSVLGSWHERNALPELIHRLSDPNKWVRAAAAWALGEIGDPSLPVLLKAVEDRAWEVRCAAISSLGHFPHKQVCEKLKVALFDGDWQVRYASVLQLGKLRCTHYLPDLYRLAKSASENEEVSSATCRALGEIASSKALPTLLFCLEDKRPKVARESDIALTKIAPKCCPQLLQMFQERRRSVESRYDIALLLGRIHATETVPSLFEMAKDDSEQGEIRYICLVLLADFSKRQALPLFLEYAQAKDPWLQKGAIVGLSQLKTVESFACLEKLLNSNNSTVGEQALSAIASFERGRVEVFTLKHLESYRDDQLTRAAVRLAATLKIKKAIPKLRDMRRYPKWQEIANWALKAIESH